MDYGQAKKRAARDLGHARAELPNNELVEDQVREYLDLFCADTQPAELRALRELAATWMQRLARFRPYLAGAVWRGTATRASAVLIDLYCDDPKSAELMLIDQGQSFDSATLERPGGGEPLPVLSLAARCEALGERATLHLTVHDHDDLRGALKPDARGRAWRGDLAALQALLSEGTPG